MIEIWIRLIVTILSGVGLYASVFMLIKARRAERGELDQPSVVQTPRARLFGNLPNALIGCGYYPALALGAWLVQGTFGWLALLAAAALAAATSLYLAYSLLYVTKMPCPYCWTSHAINWLTFVLLVVLVNLSYWR